MDFTFSVTIAADKFEDFCTDFLSNNPIPAGADGQPTMTREQWIKAVSVNYLNSLRYGGVQKVFNEGIEAQIDSLRAQQPPRHDDAR